MVHDVIILRREIMVHLHCSFAVLKNVALVDNIKGENPIVSL